MQSYFACSIYSEPIHFSPPHTSIGAKNVSVAGPHQVTSLDQIQHIFSSGEAYPDRFDEAVWFEARMEEENQEVPSFECGGCAYCVAPEAQRAKIKSTCHLKDLMDKFEGAYSTMQTVYFYVCPLLNEIALLQKTARPHNAETGSLQTFMQASW